MFTKLTDATKATIFAVLALCLAVVAALLVRFLGISSDPVMFSMWSCTPTVATWIMLLVVTRDGYSKEGWKSLDLHRLDLDVWWIAFGATLLITVAASFFFGYMRIYTGSIWPAPIAHAALCTTPRGTSWEP